MMRIRSSVLVALTCLVTACGGDVSQVAEAPELTPPPEGVLVRFDDATVAAEVVADDEGRQRGLMHREELDTDAGMLFLFAEPSSGGFWMKNTLIPLSIAYMSWEGDQDLRVLAVLDMEPCTADPCPGYPPGMSYDAALEVNQGWFDRNGVIPGDVAEVEGELPNPS